MHVHSAVVVEKGYTASSKLAQRQMKIERQKERERKEGRKEERPGGKG